MEPEITEAITTTITTTVSLLPIPQPIPLEPVTTGLDFAPFWNIQAISDMFSVVLTFFNLHLMPEFFTVFAYGMAVVIGLRFVLGIMGRRQNPEGRSMNERIQQKRQNVRDSVDDQAVRAWRYMRGRE